jgi:hypothetical protein
MPQAPFKLSRSQILALESVWLLLRTLPALLQSIGNEVRPSTREQLNEQSKLAAMNRARLVAAFPEMAEAAQRWSGQ